MEVRGLVDQLVHGSRQELAETDLDDGATAETMQVAVAGMGADLDVARLGELHGLACGADTARGVHPDPEDVAGAGHDPLGPGLQPALDAACDMQQEWAGTPPNKRSEILYDAFALIGDGTTTAGARVAGL